MDKLDKSSFLPFVLVPFLLVFHFFAFVLSQIDMNVRVDVVKWYICLSILKIMGPPSGPGALSNCFLHLEQETALFLSQCWLVRRGWFKFLWHSQYCRMHVYINALLLIVSIGKMYTINCVTDAYNYNC